MSNKRNAERARYNAKLEQQENARFQELKLSIQLRQAAEAQRLAKLAVRKYAR